MSALLYIKGLNQPISLTEEEGRMAKEVRENDSKYPPGTKVDLGVWSGNKEDMKYVVFEKNTYANTQKQYYSYHELREFEKEIEPYFIKRGDVEYNSLVALICKDILGDGQIIWSQKLVNIINELRAKNITSEQAQVEAEGIVDKYFVGKLFKDGETRFFVDNKAIRVDDFGNKIVLINRATGESPYTELNQKITEWREMKNRNEEGEEAKLQQYEDLVQQISVNHQNDF